MKVGQTLAVTVEGIEVAEALITHIDAETVTFVVPGTEVVVGIRHQLTEETPERIPEVDRAMAHEAVTHTEKPVEIEASPFVADNPEPKSLREMEFDSSVLDDDKAEKK